MAMPGVDAFLTKFLPFLATQPATVNGAAPYTFVQALLAKKSKLMVSDIANAITGPFQFLTGSYAYRKTDGAGQMTYYARTNDVDETQPAPVATPKGD